MLGINLIMNLRRFRIWLGVWLIAFAPPGRTADLPKNLPPHPRLLFRQAELPGIKARAAGPCKRYFDSLKNQADGWLSREVKLPDRGGQWFHWYSCPKHGARLRTEGPTRHVCPVDQEVFTGYPYDDVVISVEHNRLAGAIRTLGIVYQISGDSRYAAKAREILLAYADKYQSYPLHDTRGQAKVGGGKVGPQTLDESTWLITVVEGADCIWDTLASEEQEKVRNGLLVPATEVIRQHKLGIHNIQCCKNSAVGLTGLLLGDLPMVEEALHGQAGYDQQMAKGVSPDGPWFEGAWGYHFYTLNAVLHLTEGAYHSGNRRSRGIGGWSLKQPRNSLWKQIVSPRQKKLPYQHHPGSVALCQMSGKRIRNPGTSAPQAPRWPSRCFFTGMGTCRSEHQSTAKTRRGESLTAGSSLVRAQPAGAAVPPLHRFPPSPLGTFNSDASCREVRC